MGASAAAIWVARFFIGDEPDFRIVPSHYATLGNGLAYLVMGAGLGFAGITYNRTLLGTLRLADRVRRWPTEVRAALVGSAIGLVGLSQPFLVGTGEPLTQQILSASVGIRLLLVLFLVRLALGAVSYASGTPGGLLAPILALGAIAGEACGYGFRAGFPGLGVQPEAFAVVGMAAFMSAVNRSPLTAIVLVLEMTGNFPIFLPMLCACYSAMLVPTLFRDCGLYDRLRERLLEIAKR